MPDFKEAINYLEEKLGHRKNTLSNWESSLSEYEARALGARETIDRIKRDIWDLESAIAILKAEVSIKGL